MHAILTIYTNVLRDNWAELLLFVQFAYNTAYKKTTEGTLHILMFDLDQLCR